MIIIPTMCTVQIITYLNAIAAAKGDPVENHIFTGPNEERVNKSKQYIVMESDIDPTIYELGDSQTETKILYTFQFGRRDDQEVTDGMEKERADIFFGNYSRYLRSRQFKTFLAGAGIKWRELSKLTKLDFSTTQEGLRKAEIRLLIYTYIETLEDIP